MNGILKKSLLVIALLILIQVITRLVLGFDGFIEFSTVSLFLAPSIFIIGFILNATMTDYKESEKIPANIINSINVIYDTYKMCFVDQAAGEQNAKFFRKFLASEIKTAFISGNFKKCLYEVDKIKNLHVSKIDPITAMPVQLKLQAELQNLISIIRRVYTIKTTQNLPAAYTLLKFLMTGVFSMLLVAVFKSKIEMVIYTTIIPLIFTYMYNLIKDIDDPFEYDKNLDKAGNAEIEMKQFKEYYYEVRNV